jgi:PAS domain S-box-containing protein
MQEVKHKKESITSNEIVNLLSGSTDSIIWKLDSLNKFTYISGNIQTLLGFDELHFLTKAISTIFYDSDNRSIFLSELKSFQLSQQKHLNTSGCIKRKDGKPVYTDITLLHGTDNSEGEIIGCFKNLSIQKQLNHEFEKFNPTNFSDAIFSKALQTISTIVWVFNLENGHFNYSPHFLKLLGYLPEEVKPTKEFLLQSVHPDNYESIFKIIHNSKFQKSGIFKTECRIKSKNGKWKWFLCQGNVVNSLNNTQPLRIVGTFIDISESKKNEQQFKKSEARNKALLKILPDLIFIINNDYVFVDTYLHEEVDLLIPPEDFIGKSIHQIFEANLANQFRQQINKAFDAKEVQILEYSLNIKEEKKYYESRVVYIDSRHVLAIIRDITYRKEYEENLKKSEIEFKKLNETKDKLISIIAHDLKAPFNNIIGFTDLLIENSTDFSREKIDEYLYYINTSARQAHNLLENLLEWARSQSANICVQPELFELRKIINRNINLLSGNTKQKNVLIDCSVPDKLVVYADPIMMSTVIRNILSNAIKFSYPGGKIDIYTETLDDEVKLNIKDYGIGMNIDMLGKLFKINENISRKGTSGEKGTGLGLILCYEFIQKNNCKIQLISDHSQGTLFTITFPATEKF